MYWPVLQGNTPSDLTTLKKKLAQCGRLKGRYNHISGWSSKERNAIYILLSTLIGFFFLS